MTSSSTRSSMHALACSAVHVHGECNNYILYAIRPHPMWQEMSLRTPDPLSTFRGRGLGTRLISIQAPAHGMGMGLSFYVWQSWIEITIWNENENSCVFCYNCAYKGHFGFVSLILTSLWTKIGVTIHHCNWLISNAWKILHKRERWGEGQNNPL